MSKQLELFPVTKPEVKVEQKTPNNSAEYFLNKSKINPLDKLPAAIAKNFNKYDAEDGQNIVVGANGQLMTESELKQQVKKQTKISTGNMSDWDAVKKVSEKDPTEMKQIKKILLKEYNRSAKNLSDSDLKIIKRGKYSELLKSTVKPVAPIAPIVPIVPKEPEIPLEIKIKQFADARLKAKQDLWDKEHGQFGLSNLMRPK